jgi:hypothetical protein
MMNIEPGGGCALYVALTAKTPSQRGVTMRVAVIGVAVVDVVVGGGVVVVDVGHDDPSCWPETDPMTVLVKLALFKIVALTTYM